MIPGDPYILLMPRLNRAEAAAPSSASTRGRTVTDCASSWNGRLGGPAKEVLDYFAQQKAYKVIIVDVYRRLSDSDKKVLKDKGVSY